MSREQHAPTPDPRSRFVVNSASKNVLMLNYKCGFSSLSAAMSGSSGWSHEWRDAASIGRAASQGLFDGYDFHLLTRDPLRRLVSYYWDWLVRKDEDFTGPHDAFNPQFVHLREILSEQDYAEFSSASRVDRGSPTFFDRYFIANLGELWRLDEHMWPQNWAYSQAGLHVEEMTLWTMSDIPKLLERLGLPPTPPVNIGEGLKHERFFTPAACEAVSEIYDGDYSALGYDRPTSRGERTSTSIPSAAGRMRPLVSVVCPTRNGAAHLRSSLDSVLTQSYENIELIVIDGASTDSSVDILDSYGDRLRYVSEPDEGQSDAINRGFALARGEILCWLNSDDEYLAGAIENAVNAFHRTGAQFIYGDAVAVDGRGRRYGLRTNVASGAVEDLIDDGCFIVQPASFWTRHVWESVGPLRTDLHFALDYDFFIRVAKRFEILRVPHAFAIERIHSGAKTYVGHRERIEEFERVAVEHGGSDLAKGFRAEGSAVMLIEAMRARRTGDHDLYRAHIAKARRWAEQRRRTALFAATMGPRSGRFLARGRLINNLVVSGLKPSRSNSDAIGSEVRRFRTSRPAITSRLAELQRRPRSSLHRSTRTLAMAVAPSLGVLDQYEPRPLDSRSRRMSSYSGPRPSITIVTPSFNQAAYLPATIASVVSQGYDGLEYIVQDGGSTDGSVAVLRGHDSVLSAWESRPDDGQANAINIGHAKGSGEIMGWLNSDDILLPGYLAEVGALFASDESVDAVYGHRVLINEDGDEIGRWLMPRHDARALRWADYVPQETLFWRRRLWDRVGGLDESFRFAMDWDLLLRFEDAGARIVRIPRFGGGFRVHRDQLTSTAIDSIGAEEMARIRRRCHGRDVEHQEIMRGLAPYMAKHVALRTAWSFGAVRT